MWVVDIGMGCGGWTSGRHDVFGLVGLVVDRSGESKEFSSFLILLENF